MMDRWVITLEVWPFNGISQGGGAEGDQKLAGPKRRTFDVKAGDIREALEKAELIVEGIMSSGHAWKAPIFAIESKKVR